MATGSERTVTGWAYVLFLGYRMMRGRRRRLWGGTGRIREVLRVAAVKLRVELRAQGL
jgi:hypothetical protein